MKGILLHPITLFVLGIIAAIGGLALNDYNTLQTTAQAVEQPTRIAFATRTIALRATPTSTSAPTETTPPTATLEESATPETVAMAGDSAPTATSTLEFTFSSGFTSSIATTPTVSTTLATPRRVAGTPTVRLTATPTTTVVAKKGGSPYDAIDITGVWDTIAPNKQVWFKTGVQTAYPLRGIIALDAYGKKGIDFAVFSPEQAGDLNVLTTPKGRGAYDRAIPTHDLIWNGGSPKSGVWYVLLTNSNPVPVDYKLISTFSATEHKNCFQYWEYLPSGAYILWTECNRPGASPP